MIPDPTCLNAWHPVAVDSSSAQVRLTTLLGRTLIVRVGAEPTASLQGHDARPLPVLRAYGHVWTSLGAPPPALFDIPGHDDPGRRFVSCGRLTVRTSAGRIVENFLDMAHFPFVHPGLLGAEPLTEVKPYRTEIREEDGALWATECRFHQPRAALSAQGGIEAEYSYLVPAPFVSVLYKTSPGAGRGGMDIIGLFVQPREAAVSDVFPFYMIFDKTSSDAEIAEFQQMIFLQDKPILENQRPASLPLDVGGETPAPADRASIAYRRWLKAKDVRFGCLRATA